MQIAFQGLPVGLGGALDKQVECVVAIVVATGQHHAVARIVEEGLGAELYLTEFDTEALYLHLRVLTAAIEQVAVGIAHAEVARAIVAPSVGTRDKALSGASLVVPIARHQLRSGHPELAHGTLGHVVTVLVDDACCHAAERLADGGHAVMMLGMAAG